MSTGSKITGFALQDILDGIANGLNEAQQSLREMAPYDQFGRPNTVYQLPYLDFNLQVTSAFDSQLDQNNNREKKLMRFAPAEKSLITTQAKTALFSTISGRFIASIPNDGIPQTVLNIETSTPVKKDSYYETSVAAFVQNTASEKLPNSKVEFNFDEELTQVLNTVTTIPEVTDGEVYTDQNGKSETLIKIPYKEYDEGKSFVFNINVGNLNQTISIGK